MNTGPGIKVYKDGEEILKKVAEPVNPEEFNSKDLEQVISDLKQIVTELGAVGFAAPQIGHSKRVMMIGMEFENPRRPNVKPFPHKVFVNPEVTYASPETDTDWEGCASIDDLVAYVPRSVMIKYKAQDPTGVPFEGELNNFHARVFLHELDHLNGKLMNENAIEIKRREDLKEHIISLKP